MAFDTINLFMIIVMFGIIATMLYYVYRGWKVKRRKGVAKVMTPKLRARAILQDKRFGAARVEGYEPIGAGFEKAIVWLRSWDGHFFSQIYNMAEITPQNNIQAMAGAHTPVWVATGMNHPAAFIDVEKYELQKQNAEMKEESIKINVQKKQISNEAALLPDKMEEIIKEMQKPRAPQEIRFK